MNAIPKREALETTSPLLLSNLTNGPFQLNLSTIQMPEKMSSENILDRDTGARDNALNWTPILHTFEADLDDFELFDMGNDGQRQKFELSSYALNRSSLLLSQSQNLSGNFIALSDTFSTQDSTSSSRSYSVPTSGSEAENRTGSQSCINQGEVEIHPVKEP